jgi:photosystem II stability/assembly factor-like uncharacterized protein
MRTIRPKRAMWFVLALVALAPALNAQTPPAAFKGIWEPVSFTEDLELLDVFFANVDVGWVAGAGGTILHTTDGGKTWTAQLGGDPADEADPISILRFFDERHGWAVQRRKLLRTTDGEEWEEIGTLPDNLKDLFFVSAKDGFANGMEGGVVGVSNIIYRTSDGGKTWKRAWACTAKVVAQGLAQQLDCDLHAFHFPTPQVGYVVIANSQCIGPGCGAPPLIAKTEDGGDTWQIIPGPGLVEQDMVTSLFFLDEKTGFVRLESGKLHVTRDGGETWKGLVASPGPWIRFADPGVGWAVNFDKHLTMTYTTDGGARWNARKLLFPANVNGASLPRRDRGFVVGDHGMIYRYRVVPAAYTLKADDIAAPAMPGFDSPLDEQIDQLGQILTELNTAVGPLPADGSTKASTAAESGGESIDAPLPPPSEFTAKCCSKSFSRLEVLLGALAQTLPQFIAQYKNLNILLAAARMGSDMPDQYRSVKSGLRAFRKADSKEAAQSALASVSSALQAFKQTTAIAFQKELPAASGN